MMDSHLTFDILSMSQGETIYFKKVSHNVLDISKKAGLFSKLFCSRSEYRQTEMCCALTVYLNLHYPFDFGFYSYSSGKIITTQAAENSSHALHGYAQFDRQLLAWRRVCDAVPRPRRWCVSGATWATLGAFKLSVVM